MLEERNKKLVSENIEVATVNMEHVSNDQDVTSSIDPVTDDVVVDNEVTIVTVTNNDDSSNKVASTQHSEIIQSNNFILIPSYEEGMYIGTIQYVQ